MTTALQERVKYSKMWAVPEYRHNSPGERCVQSFLNSAGPFSVGDTLIDLGCGTGRASISFSSFFRVYLLDLCESALDEQARRLNLPFIEACLWDLPFSSQFDWFYCADVMEHIPTEHVDTVLDGIVRLTGKGGMFHIALFQDGFGQVIGERLHLTVQSSDWWMEKINKRWNVGKWESDGARLLVFVGKGRVYDSGSN